MNKIQYFYYKEHFNKEGVEYGSHSIIVTLDDLVIKYIPDVFLNEDDARNFVSLCNKLKLSVIHIYDAVEDFVGM